MKKTMLLLATLALLMVGCRRYNTTIHPRPEICVWSNGQWATEWMEAYADYVANVFSERSDKRVLDVYSQWELVYIDDDSIPEMVLLCPSEAYGNIVLSYYDGKVSEWNSWRCNAEFIPYSGLICNRDGSMDVYWNKVVRLKDGQFSEIYNHTDIINYNLSHDTTVTVDCIFNGDTTLGTGCKMDHDSILNELFYSKGEAFTFDNKYLDRLEVGIFEKDWRPTLPDGVTREEISLFVLSNAKEKGTR